ncbi:MAG: hypothetical protein GY829_15015 [Gammaproteobacteria bacterium]|nr:hypothetical protein [Gammaproteobacteria bacterium]
MLKTTIHFLATIVITTVLISIVSSQLVLADIQSFGLDISNLNRLEVTAKDIIGIGPILLLMIGLSFLVAFIIARYSFRFFGGNKKVWTITAGLFSFPVTLYLIKYFMGVTILASARTTVGMLFIACCCAIGGWIYSILSTKPGDNTIA